VTPVARRVEGIRKLKSTHKIVNLAKLWVQPGVVSSAMVFIVPMSMPKIA
jgi:hypothetical protein